MNAKQFAWLYLVENGVPFQKPSYYGGFELVSEIPNHKYDRYDYMRQSKIVAIAKDLIKNHGVNWDKTDAPVQTTYYEFAGTECDSRSTEYLEGTLILNNGQDIFWCGENIQVTNVFEQMANASLAPAKFKEIFGE